MSQSAFRAYAESKGFRPQTLARWDSWPPADRDSLAELALGLKVSENHLRDLLDWLEEISLRDGVAVAAILQAKEIDDAVTDPRRGRADRLQRLKELLRRRRFPRLAETEDAIATKIRELKLHPEIRMSVPAGLEGGRLQVDFSAASTQELRDLADRLRGAAEVAAIAEIFQLLAGQK
jgi:hypothetical protein